MSSGLAPRDDVRPAARLPAEPGRSPRSAVKAGTSAAASPANFSRLVKDRLARWSRLWRVPGFCDRVSVELSPRLRRAWARTHPRQVTIALHPELLRSPVLEQVLCREAAYLASWLLHGSWVGPDSPECRELVRRAGFDPMAPLGRPRTASPARNRGPARFEHRCLICQTSRVSPRPMYGWRCEACASDGLSGALEIARVRDEAEA